MTPKAPNINTVLVVHACNERDVCGASSHSVGKQTYVLTLQRDFHLCALASSALAEMVEGPSEKNCDYELCLMTMEMPHHIGFQQF